MLLGSAVASLPGASGPLGAQEPPDLSTASSQTEPLDTEALLADPILGRASFHFLVQLRRWAALQRGQPEAFERVAEDFAGRGAYFSAVEMLWWADQLSDDPERRAAYQRRMREWIALTAPAETLTEQSRQLFAAGEGARAIDGLRQVLADHPFYEKGYYEWANVFFLLYLARAEGSGETMPLPARQRLFRSCYDALQYTLALDPLFYDAHYLLSRLREILHDDAEFLIRSQFLTERAVAFRGEVIPPLEKIEDGGRDASLFVELGRGFEAVGAAEYAVFAYEAALRHGAADADLRQRIESLTTPMLPRP